MFIQCKHDTELTIEIEIVAVVVAVDGNDGSNVGESQYSVHRFQVSMVIKFQPSKIFFGREPSKT